MVTIIYSIKEEDGGCFQGDWVPVNGKHRELKLANCIESSFVSFN